MLETTPNLVVCISEGIHDKNGTFVCELAGDIGTDTFGHKTADRIRKISGKLLSKSESA